MKENASKKTWFQTLRTLWVPLAIGVVTVAALAVVVGMVWKDYRTAMMDSQTRQMELVVQSTADSIRVLLEEYADRLDSIAGKAEASKAFRPTVTRSDTIRDVWLENSNGEVIYSCYGLSAVCDVLITRTEDISYWQYHSGDEHYLVMKKKAGDETACLVVDSTVMYQQLISEIHVGRNGYIMIKNDDNLVVMHPEAVQWGIKVVEGRQRIYQGKELDMSSLSELLRAQQEEESGTLDYYSYWWADPNLPRVHKISAFRHLDVGGSFWIVSAVVDYDDFYEPVQQSFVKVALIFGGVALVLVLFMFQMFRLQERDRRSATEISDLKTLNQTLEELHRSEESLAHGQRLQMMGTLTGGIAHEFNNFLTPITGYADLIMADADPGSEIYDNAMEISEAAQKAQEVVKQISSMSRKNVETVYDAVSVEGLLHRTRKLVETNCPKNVELKEENELSGECVLGNATQLQQVLLNISINAAYNLIHSKSFPVIRIGIWRWIFIQIHDIDMKSPFTGSSSTSHTDGHRHSLRLLRCCPADPSQLTVARRIIYLPYLIASSLYGKCYGYRMIRITLPAAYLYCRNHFRIRPIFIIIGRDFRFFWRHIPEPYNTKTQGTLYFTVGTDSRCRTSPGRISQIRCFQKHGKRQVLKCHCWKDSTKPTT